MWKFCAGWALILVGLLVAVHMVIEPLYYVTDPKMPVNFVWEAINPALAAAILLGCGAAYVLKRRTERDGTVSRAWITANVHFYGFLAVAMLFFWNWFNVLNPAFAGTHPPARFGNLDGYRRSDAIALAVVRRAAGREGMTEVARGAPVRPVQLNSSSSRNPVAGLQRAAW